MRSQLLIKKLMFVTYNLRGLFSFNSGFPHHFNYSAAVCRSFFIWELNVFNFFIYRHAQKVFTY